jgi:hypothetical protein
VGKKAYRRVAAKARAHMRSGRRQGAQKGSFPMKRFQGSFEYVMLVAGMVMLVVIVVMVGLGTTSQSNSTLAQSGSSYGGILNETAAASVPLPDLTVNGTTSVGCPAGNYVRAVITNLGKRISPPVHVKYSIRSGLSGPSPYQIRGLFYDESPSLQPGDWGLAQCVPFEKTDISIAIHVDPEGRVNEYNKSNNEMVVMIPAPV